VVLRLLINERGTVDEVTVVRAEPIGVFEKSALAAFRGARFSPGMRYGAAVKSQLLVEVQYRMDPRAASGRGYGS
jgi:TonB family protein